MSELTNEEYFYLCAQEARSRLTEGIAGSIDEVIEQLVEECLISDTEREAMRMTLEMP
jgi:hypothetical protein